MASFKIETGTLLLRQLQDNGFEKPQLEYHFIRELIPDGPKLRERIKAAGLKDWRFDYAWPSVKIAIELDGGQWKPGGGKHGTDDDYHKINVATSLGWKVYRFTHRMVQRNQAIKFMKERS